MLNVYKCVLAEPLDFSTSHFLPSSLPSVNMFTAPSESEGRRRSHIFLFHTKNGCSILVGKLLGIIH